jgi:hypothetical protein
MYARMPWLLGAFAIVTVATAMPAAAKSVPMPALSRGAVDQACTRAGGVAYGVHDDNVPYGCSALLGKVDCSPDARCEGYVYDLRPIPANSLEAVLGGGVHAGPTKIGPTDRRIAAQP